MRLSTHGDRSEIRFWSAFVADRFPSYETFWLRHVVPLTRRGIDPADVRLLSRDQLSARGDEGVAVAQLHFTTLMHLGRAYDLLNPSPGDAFADLRLDVLPGPGSAVLQAASASAVGPSAASSGTFARVPEWEAAKGPSFDFDRFVEAFVRLAAANDVADELLQRRATPGEYAPWDEKQGKNARWAWRQKNGDPLKPIRDYRNRLVHGRIVPRLVDESGTSWYPRLDKVNDYVDWRRIDEPTFQITGTRDFDRGDALVSAAWDQTLSYVETNWRTRLLAD